MYLSKPTLLRGLTFNCVKSQMKYIPLSACHPSIHSPYTTRHKGIQLVIIHLFWCIRTVSMTFHRPAIIATSVAHALAWAAFLWLTIARCAFRVIYEVFQQTPQGGWASSQDIPAVSSFACFLPYVWWGLFVFFVPVILTGVALILVLVWRMPRLWGTLILGILSAAGLACCLLGYLSWGLLYVPSVLALITGTVLFSRRQLDEL